MVCGLGVGYGLVAPWLVMVWWPVGWLWIVALWLVMALWPVADGGFVILCSWPRLSGPVVGHGVVAPWLSVVL